MHPKLEKTLNQVRDWAANLQEADYALEQLSECRTSVENLAVEHACYRCEHATVSITKFDMLKGEYGFESHVLACSKFAISMNTDYKFQVANTWPIPFFCSSESNQNENEND